MKNIKKIDKKTTDEQALKIFRHNFEILNQKYAKLMQKLAQL